MGNSVFGNLLNPRDFPAGTPSIRENRCYSVRVKRIFPRLVLLSLALWVGGGVFLTAVVGPTIFSKALSEVITRQQAGSVAQAILSRYFVFQTMLAVIAFAGSFWARAWGWRCPSLALPLSSVLLILTLGSGLVLQPRMREWNAIRYSPARTSAEQEAARVQFARWHGMAQMGNLLVLTGALVLVWQQRVPSGPPSSRTI